MTSHAHGLLVILDRASAALYDPTFIDRMVATGKAQINDD